MIGLPILFLLFFSDLTRLIFLGLMLIATSYEYLQINNCFKKSNSFIAIISLVLCLLLGVYAYNTSVNDYLIYAGVAVLIFQILDLFGILKIDPTKGALFKVLFYPAIYISCYITFHSLIGFRELVIGTILLIWVSDIAAYFVGRSIGKRKLMPTVSPGKTIEGFLGAGMITMIVSYLLFSVFGVFDISTWFVIAFLVWLLGSIGDLVESRLKRALDIKDSGSILPGHGGFLDRFDGFIFCLPAIAFYIITFL